MMEPNNDNEQIPDQPIISKKWLKLFLGLNLFALLALFVWEISAPALMSDEELQKTHELELAAISAAISKNPKQLNWSGALSPEIEYTVDATDGGKWVHFSFATGEVFSRENIDKGSLKWDLAFRRAKVVTNGGATNPNGRAAVAAMEEVNFESVVSAPLSGMQVDKTTANIMETKSPVLDGWYMYDFWTHQLKPKPTVYIMTTADGHYAKFQFTRYYCLTVAACYRFRYVYQGSGSASFVE